MGLSIELSVHDESIKGVYVPGSFVLEIYGDDQIVLSDFLTPQEEKIARPNNSNGVVDRKFAEGWSDKREYRERDPRPLKQALKKIWHHAHPEEFEDIFEQCFAFLDKAIKTNKKVLWELDY